MSRELPSREDIVAMVASNMFGTPVLNNAHRGEVVEMMVLAALGDDWRHVGLGWNPWDLERGRGESRVRLQVKQTAAIQLWGPTRHRRLQFGWKANPPGYFERDSPGVMIEQEGWFCEAFVFGIHDEVDPATRDQVDPAQWRFMVISTSELEAGTRGISLERARERWPTVAWADLREELEQRLAGNRV